MTGVFYLFSIRPYYISTITRRHLILDENNKLKLVEMNLPNDITFTYAYLIENYGSLTLKALGGGGCFPPSPVWSLADNFWSRGAFSLEILWLFPLLNVELQQNKKFKIYILGHVTWPYLVSGHWKNAEIWENAHNFWHSGSNSMVLSALETNLMAGQTQSFIFLF